MHLIDWLILTIPVIIVAVVAFRTQRYMKGVSDFLVGGRVANRYVVCVAGDVATMGLISAVAIFESYYKSGFGYSFWNGLSLPIGLIILLTGFAVYRYRETRAMTLGQYLEIRYSKNFRIFAGVLQSIAGIINYALFPAVGARFFMYFCDLPTSVFFLGMNWPTFAILMAFFLAIAVMISVLGGQITIMATDCVQGILSYPMYLVVVIAIVLSFSWKGQMAPVLLDRLPGESLLNPFDIKELRDFNLFYVIVGLIGTVYNRLSWSGTQGYLGAAHSAHEQKMGAILGTWRGGFAGMMFILIAVASFTYMHHSDFAERAAVTDNGLIQKTMSDVAHGKEFKAIRDEVEEYNLTGKMSKDLRNRISTVRGEDARAAKEQGKSAKEIESILNPEDPGASAIAATALKSENRSTAQVFETIHGQMRVPVVLRDILPIGVTGIFCSIMLFLMISTDTTYMHSWGSILIQDIVLPFRKKAFTPKQQLFWLRMAITGVAIFAFFFSLYFGQVTYILMFFALTGAIWMGGAGIVIIGGLYWKRGTTAGAWVGMITGSGLAVLGLLGTKYWANFIYPILARSPAMLAWVTKIIEGISDPFRPIIEWRVTPDKFPINGQEMFFITILMATLTYGVLSMLTGRIPFNMDRMLHRGKYRRESEPAPAKPPRSAKQLLLSLLGITSEFTRGDRILSWSVFIYSMGWRFGVWLIILFWNLFVGYWSNDWWANWFYIQYVIVAAAIAVVSTFWFAIGGTLGLRDMFRRLAKREVNILDSGQVIGHVSADDVAMVEKIEHTRIAEAHEDQAMPEEGSGEEAKD